MKTVLGPINFSFDGKDKLEIVLISFSLNAIFTFDTHDLRITEYFGSEVECLAMIEIGIG